MNKKITSVMLSACLLFSVLPLSSATVNAAEETASVSAEDYGLAEDIQQGQILQCWNWSFSNIKANMKKIAEQGFTAIQTSPVQGIKENVSGCSIQSKWWVYYQPINFSMDTSSSNPIGTKSQFKAMCDEAHKYGVRVIVDVIMNHMANKTKNDLSDKIIADLRNDSNCWHSIKVNSSIWTSRWDITHNCMDGLPDLNTGNTKVQNYAIKFLKECIDAGADGFRFDGAKHIEVPNDLENASSNYWTNVLGQATSYAKSTRGITPYYYGEVLHETGGKQPIVDQYTSLMSITANGVGNDIRTKVNQGNASAAVRTDLKYSEGTQPAPNKAVLWNESHDNYANEGSNSLSETVLKKTWALVGTRADICGLYLARPTSMNATLGSAGITGWADKEVREINHFKNYMVGKSESLSSSGSIAYNERGTEGVVLVNCGGSSANVEVPAKKMAPGTYTDAVSGTTFTVSNGKIKGKIGSIGIAVVYNENPPVLVGDTDGDKSISIIDATSIQSHLVKLKTLSGDNLKAADVNQDSSVSVLDVTCIQCYLVGLTSKSGSCGKTA